MPNTHSNSKPLIIKVYISYHLIQGLLDNLISLFLYYFSMIHCNSIVDSLPLLSGKKKNIYLGSVCFTSKNLISVHQLFTSFLKYYFAALQNNTRNNNGKSLALLVCTGCINLGTLNPKWTYRQKKKLDSVPWHVWTTHFSYIVPLVL